MIGDIRHPRPHQDGEQNKQSNFKDEPPQPGGDAPHLYGREEGFMAAKASRKLKQIRWPRAILKHGSRREKALSGALVAVMLVGGFGGAYALHKSMNKQPVATPIVQKTEPKPEKPVTVSKLTGVPVSDALSQRSITGIMIENSPDARPQSGLRDAGVVYEAIAEGGITRFLALYQESQPAYIGPVRSVRPYYVELLLPFDSSLAHAGGSAEGLARVRTEKVKDLDHGSNPGAFQRVSDRYAPHNLYTSMAALDQASAARKHAKSNVKSFERKKDQPSKQPKAKNISIDISSPLYDVQYNYDPATNTYHRIMGGRPHNDHRSGQIIRPKVVITMVMNYSQNGIYSVYQTAGNGDVFIFQDGEVHKGKWSRKSHREQFSFKDAAGKPIKLNPGQTWITLIKAPNAVSYGP